LTYLKNQDSIGKQAAERAKIRKRMRIHSTKYSYLEDEFF
jgi:hypothetical protein